MDCQNSFTAYKSSKIYFGAKTANILFSRNSAMTRLLSFCELQDVKLLLLCVLLKSSTNLPKLLALGPDAVPLFLLKARQSAVVLGERGTRKMLSFLC